MAEAQSYELFKAINNFADNLNQQLRTDSGLIHHNGNNNLFSPISTHAFLSLLMQDPCFVANNQLFGSVLGIQDFNGIIELYKDLLATFNSVNNTLIYNTCFLNTLNKLQGDFKNAITKNFDSTINFLKFTAHDGAVEVINSWFADKTNHKLTQFNNIKNDTCLTFLSATHFENNWCDQFATEYTEHTSFHVTENRTIQVQMMKKTGEFYYKKAPSGFKILKLPFLDSSVSLVVILPEKSVGLHELRIWGFQGFTPYLKDMSKTEVDVSLPKFKISGGLQMTNYLKEMRLEEMFSANLLDIIDDDEPNLSSVEQKVYLNINEKGSEASTGTISILTKGSEEKVLPENGLIIYETNITTEISNRFARTLVVWRVKNSNQTAADAEFKVVLTETAFITELAMEIEGKTYKSHIKEKEAAKNIFMEAVTHGQSAGLVEAKTRDSKEFSVSVNLEPDSVAVFSLTYEEMLQRLHDQYELVLNICPVQIVDDLTVEVRINESRALKFVKAPPLRSGNEISSVLLDKRLDPEADIKIINARTATVKFYPNASKQMKLARNLQKDARQGLAGQFVVQYDVERGPQNGEILLQDGYFIHFFASNNLDPLPKHVVFVLDTSGSMMGRKIEQLKDAMMNILDDLKRDDMLSIIEFNCEVIVWDTNLKKCTTLAAEKIKNFKEPFSYLQNYILADPQQVSTEIIKKAKEVIQGLIANGSTFMIGGLETALYLVKTSRMLNENKSDKLQPIIIFLTDGEPNVGVQSTHEIVELVTQLNSKDKAPIFSLSFGNDADKDFLRKLSLKNLGFSRHIYEAADASLQLQEFYKQISSPLLHDIKFKYDAEVEQVTRTWFPIYFKGAELVVAGRYKGSTFPTLIDCCGPYGPLAITSTAERPASSLERLWAYLTVKQLLDERELAINPAELTKRAIDLALKYSFVTDVTSLVVVKPNDNITSVDNRPTNFDRHIDNEIRFSRVHRNQKRTNSVMIDFAGNPGDGYIPCVVQGVPLIPPSMMFGARSANSAPVMQCLSANSSSTGQRRALFGGGYTSCSAGVFGAPPPPPPSSQGSVSFGIPCSAQTLLSETKSGVKRCKSGETSSGYVFPWPGEPPIAVNTPTQGPTDYSIDQHSSMEVNDNEQDNMSKQEKLREEFTADRPFFVALVSEKDDNFLILLQGRIYDPNNGI